MAQKDREDENQVKLSVYLPKRYYDFLRRAAADDNDTISGIIKRILIPGLDAMMLLRYRVQFLLIQINQGTTDEIDEAVEDID